MSNETKESKRQSRQRIETEREGQTDGKQTKQRMSIVLFVSRKGSMNPQTRSNVRHCEEAYKA